MIISLITAEVMFIKIVYCTLVKNNKCNNVRYCSYKDININAAVVFSFQDMRSTCHT